VEYFAELDSYEAEREYQDWLDSCEDVDLDWPDDMSGEEDNA